jgi:DNA-binding CsgD family transcriptional regulator
MMPGKSSMSLSDRSAPQWVATLKFESTFEQAKSQAMDTLRQWYPQRHSCELDLSAVEACAVIKNRAKASVRQNAAYQYFFPCVLPTASTDAEACALYRTTQLSQNTDALIAEGMLSLDCEHEGKTATGQSYLFRTFKCHLDEFHDPNCFILSISRPTARLERTAARDKPLLELLAVFQSLDATDQRTCRMDAEGQSTKDIAATLGLSPRAIEQRRKKMFERFSVQRPMELARITIRLEEHGLLCS